jgi:TPR repeat protein
MRTAWFLGLLASTAGCGQLGSSQPTTLPGDVHAVPTAAELSEHPCRHADVARCIAKCTAGQPGDDPQACNAAGVMFEFDGGTYSDPVLASGFYGRSCEGNYGPGCNNLAWLYLRGRGVAQDQPHAMLLFMTAFDASRIACTHGDPSGCLLAGELLYEGHAEPKDGETAVAFFRLACEGGQTQACELATEQ